MLDFIPVAPGWVVLLVAAGAVVAGWLALRVHRARLAVAAARPVPIGEAVAGRVALIGAAEPAGGAPLQAPLSGQPCVWYRYRVEAQRIDRRNDRDEELWEETSRGVSGAPVILRDRTGAARIEPQGAGMAGVPRRVWTGDSPWPAGRPQPGAEESRTNTAGTWRYTEEIIPPGAMLFVIGAMAPQGGARDAAPKVVRAPENGPFIISTDPPGATARRFGAKAWGITAAAGLAAVAAAGLMLRWAL